MVEARIVSVADVFDALTSARPYKPAWSNDDAFAMLRRLAPEKLESRESRSPSGPAKEV